MPSLVNKGVEGSWAAFSFLQTQTVSHQINLPAEPEAEAKNTEAQFLILIMSTVDSHLLSLYEI